VVPDGRLLVYSADKGEKLHEINTGLRLGMGPPITYMLDGKQYVALTGGRGTVVAPPGAPAAAAGTGGAAAGGGPATPAVDTTPVPPRLMVFALGGGTSK
jgi:quinohemoprotein ethanol dehydrogenase